MRRRVLFTAVCCSLLAVGASSAVAGSSTPVRSPESADASPAVALTGSVGSVRPPQKGPHVGSHGATIIVDAHGLLVAERNAGAVVRSDRQGNPVARLPMTQGLGELVHDGAGLVFVADRGADRVVRLSPGDARGQGLGEAAAVTIAEPHGLALTPDGRTLLVTSVADHQLVAVDTQQLRVRWRVTLEAEPRGVAVSSDGRRAVVGFLASGALATVDLASAGPRVRWQSLDPRDHIIIDEADGEDEEFFSPSAQLHEARSRFQVPSDTGRRQARNVYAVGFIGDDLAVAPHQLATPQMKRRPQEDNEDSYGGGVVSIPPLVHRLATVAGVGTSAPRVSFDPVEIHQPRALAYQAHEDVLLLGGYGDDRVVAVSDASQQAPYVRWVVTAPARDGECGVDGLAVDGDEVFVHCELTRRVLRLDVAGLRSGIVRGPEAWHAGPELAASLRSELVEHGAELFRRGRDHRLSDVGVLACASCHPEGRSDGLTWRLGKSILQTPMLAGRVVGTAPYKWDGQDPSLRDSIRHTIGRLGGSPERLSRRDVQGLMAYISSMSPPRTPSVDDPDAVARGRALFANDALACDICHSGDKYTDGSQYPLYGRMVTNDTPSLVGLAHTAPYYHDGSAEDLRALLTDKGSVHEMADLSSLDEAGIADLSAYLRSL